MAAAMPQPTLIVLLSTGRDRLAAARGSRAHLADHLLLRLRRRVQEPPYSALHPARNLVIGQGLIILLFDHVGSVNMATPSDGMEEPLAFFFRAKGSRNNH